MIREFFQPDAAHGFYVQYRVMNYDKACKRHFPVSKFWSDKDLQKVREDRVYFFSPAFREYGKNIVTGSYVVWADFDGVTLDDIDFRGFAPSLVLNSGGGVHAYWRFCDFVPVEDLAFVLSLVVNRLGSDILARDVTRFMRVPLSFNLKFEPPRQCAVLSRSGDYEFEDFARRLMSLSAVQYRRSFSPLIPSFRACTLYRRGNEDGAFWFWQMAQPYSVGEGDVIAREFDGSTFVSVSALGGRDVLWAGRLGDVPENLRGYLSEVRILGGVP